MGKVRCFILIASVFVSMSAHSQIIVNDPAAAILQTVNQVQTMAQWTSQLAEMKSQYEQMTRDYALAQQQYASGTGSRGLGSVDYDASISGMIANPESMWGSSSQTQQIISDEQLSGDAASMRKGIEARSIQIAASRKAAGLTAAKSAIARLNQVEMLMSRINATSDQKSINEIQARIGIEQAVLATEQSRHQAVMQSAAAEESLVKEQKAAYSRRILDPTIQSMPSIK